jgi:hypothetical protein
MFRFVKLCFGTLVRAGHSRGLPPERILASAEHSLRQFSIFTQTFATGARAIFGADDILVKHRCARMWLRVCSCTRSRYKSRYSVLTADSFSKAGI